MFAEYWFLVHFFLCFACKIGLTRNFYYNYCHRLNDLTKCESSDTTVSKITPNENLTFYFIPTFQMWMKYFRKKSIQIREFLQSSDFCSLPFIFMSLKTNYARTVFFPLLFRANPSAFSKKKLVSHKQVDFKKEKRIN